MTKRNTWIADWRPDDETFWKSTGKPIAQRNLIGQHKSFRRVG